MARRRILLLTPWYPSPGQPAAGLFVRRQAEALAARFDVAVLVAPLLGAGRLLGRRPADPAAVQVEEAGVAVLHRPVVAPVPRSWWLAQPLVDRAVRAGAVELEAAGGRFDLVHAHVTLPSGPAAVALGRRLGVPVILTEHASDFAMHLDGPGKRRLARAALRAVNAVLAVSPSLAEAIRAFEPSIAPRIVPNVVPTGFFSPAQEGPPAAPSAPPGRARLLSVGLFTPRKGFADLVRAAARLVEAGRDVELVLAGDGPERTPLEALAAKLLPGRVRFPGLLEPQAVRDAMRWCDVFVLASRRESFGVVLAEAMACGRPVVATRSGGPEWVVEPGTGLLVAPGDVAELARAIGSVLDGGTGLDADVIRARAVARFGEAAFLEAVGAVYEAAWSDGAGGTSPGRISADAASGANGGQMPA
ncbi:MAG TPA: glycosyltransferase [Candidatus Limnocylindrales bacterium]